MKKNFKDEETGIVYELINEYYYPCLFIDDIANIGRYGRKRLAFLKECNQSLYDTLFINGELEHHLLEVNDNAYCTEERIINEFALSQGVNEELKTNDMIKWTGMMNNIRHSAEEIVLNDIVYV